MLFLSGRDSGVVFSRLVHYQLVLRFAMSVFSPWDQRGKSGSRNRELDSGSGLKIGLSGILGFAWNESRHVNSRGAFPTAHGLVHLLTEDQVFHMIRCHSAEYFLTACLRGAEPSNLL